VPIRSANIIAVLVVAALLGCGGPDESGSVAERLAEGWRTYATGDFEVAEALFQGVLKRAGLSEEQRYSALLGLATAQHYKPKPDLKGALETYTRLGQPSLPAAVRQSLLGVGMVRLLDGNTPEGQAALSELIDRFPDSPEADEAVVQLADSLFRPQLDKEAETGYRLASPAFIRRGKDLLSKRLESHPDNPLAAVMRMMLAAQLIEEQSYAEAVSHLRAALDFGIESARTRSTVTWQIARIAEKKLHDYALAEQYYAYYVENFRRSQLYYRALLSRDRMRKLLAEGAEE